MPTITSAIPLRAYTAYTAMASLTSPSTDRGPVVRIFGSTPEGVHCCVHVHGVFPYFYVPCVGSEGLSCRALESGLEAAFEEAFTARKKTYKVTPPCFLFSQIVALFLCHCKSQYTAHRLLEWRLSIASPSTASMRVPSRSSKCPWLARATSRRRLRCSTRLARRGKATR